LISQLEVVFEKSKKFDDSEILKQEIGNKLSLNENNNKLVESQLVDQKRPDS